MKQKRTWLLLLLSTCLTLTSCNHSVNQTSQNAIPSPSMPNPAASDALKELRKMSGAVEMGLNIQTYTERMIDMKAEVEEKLSQIPEGELKGEIKAAEQAFIDAKTLWNSAATRDNIYSNEIITPLLKKYGIPTKTIGPIFKGDKPFESTPKKVALSLVWSQADKHIERATQLNNKTVDK